MPEETKPVEPAVESTPAVATPGDAGVDTPEEDFQAWREKSEAGATKDTETLGDTRHSTRRGVGPTVSAEAAESPDTAKPAAEPEAAKPPQETDEDDELDEPETDASDANSAQKPRKKGGFRRTIDRLNRQNQELTAKLSALEQRLAPPIIEGRNGPVSEQPESKSGEDKMPVETDYPDDFTAYLRAVTDWQTRKTLKEHEETRAREEAERRVKEAERKIHATWQERQAAVAKNFADYEDVVRNSQAPMSMALQDLLLEAEDGPEILYHLAKNPAEAERIFTLTPTAQIREVERMAQQFRPKSAPQSKTTPVTSAPKPVRPLAGGSAPDAEGAAPQTEFYDAWFPKQQARLDRARQRG